ncbi:MAG TPA: hypothetical protein ENJ64_01120 [Thiotrichales bacterium]|nr:hypothetical protein [Thiotrichales bacterium]
MKVHSLTGVTCMLTLFLQALTIAPASAAVTYRYSGNTFNTFSAPTSYTSAMSVTGSFELAAPLAANLFFADLNPLSFSFSDGINTITDATATQSSFQFATDFTGEIAGWRISVSTSDGFVFAGDTIFSIETVADPVLGNFFDRGRIQTCLFPANNTRCGSFTDDFGSIFGEPASWNLVPLPAAAWLFSSGFISLFAAQQYVRRKNRTGQ